ncbi:MAG: hypothetical protein J0M12_16415, partial [Deltaproteobacteria bacterium]|nr:hypothetical protein [Deltaproteobacteria bacterium]
TPHAYFFDELPLRESLRFITACFGMSPTEATESLHHFLGNLRLDEKAAFLTPGQRTQLLVHLALSSRAKLILLDEVVSRLDSMSLEVAAKRVQNYLARGSALILVEHGQSYPWINREIHLSDGLVA